MPREDAEYRRLQERAFALAELQKSDGWEEIRAYVDFATRKRRDRIVNGLAGSFEEYLKESWECVGMMKVLDIPAIFGRMLEEEQKQRLEAGESLT